MVAVQKRRKDLIRLRVISILLCISTGALAALSTFDAFTNPDPFAGVAAVAAMSIYTLLFCFTFAMTCCFFSMSPSADGCEQSMSERADRDEKDFAIEFGEYLAKDVERFLDFLNKTGVAARAPDQHQMTDHWRGLQSAIYEFRKRALRAAKGGA